MSVAADLWSETGTNCKGLAMVRGAGRVFAVHAENRRRFSISFSPLDETLTFLAQAQPTITIAASQPAWNRYHRCCHCMM